MLSELFDFYKRSPEIDNIVLGFFDKPKSGRSRKAILKGIVEGMNTCRNYVYEEYDNHYMGI